MLARVPALADGSYTLRIVTQFSTNTELKNPRTLEYKDKLIVGNSGGGGEDDRPVIE
uniref:DUF4469 domain-containing protein n=1 Tax=Parabacteroides gordonii TaxID=574930 RepID=UPI0021C30260|nr:DUF4469 domain-containing protein [Parabacteroides gordonii]